MKKVFIISILALGFTTISFGQSTTPTMQSTDNVVMIEDGMIKEKNEISPSSFVYVIIDMKTGIFYESLPTPASFVVGERVIRKLGREMERKGGGF